ncbi:hypothetical protein [Desulfosporosinus hippei]|uniref:DUF4367 domain-containing protein n=1 Tax=Desulfosporosinus hippei DSM 8344 TaxID=1121419 RepID=A0A1G8BGC1_9FIRM|nr:hypothetical protein [Desulfosporosinus hippei]SDH32295.1 hypothetical protein SAMN05443529_11230 [Desulfosporosinus hippei DSM 8344]
MKKHIILGVVLGFCLALIMRNPILSVNSYINTKVLKHNLNNQLVLNLSESTKVMETPIIERGQLLYSVYLNDQTILIRGYIQIWNLDDLENYLVNSKRISTFDFHSYSLKPIKIANENGCLTEWTASFGESYRISGVEYWLKKSDTSGVLRISFFTDTTSFSKDQMSYIDKIINSITWSKYTNAI